MNDRVVLAVEAKSARPGETKLSRLPSPAFGTAAQIACIGWEYELWQVWRVPTALEANGKLFPSFSSLLAHRPVDKAATFALDYSYQTDSIPVYSATDVLSGKVGARELAGKDVLFAAPAPGDRKSVVEGQCVYVRGDLGGRRIIKK